jgi:hypothetical protein
MAGKRKEEEQEPSVSVGSPASRLTATWGKNEAEVPEAGARVGSSASQPQQELTQAPASMDVGPSVGDTASDELTPMDIGSVLGMMAALIEEPTIDLSKDHKLKNSKFLLEKVEAGRKKEIDNLMLFDAVGPLDEYDGKVYDMVWVEEMRGKEVRSRACVRQYNEEKREDVFAATPGTAFVKFLASKGATNKDFAMLISGISVAFMHARSDKEIVVKPPPRVVTSKYWRLLAAVDGTLKASQHWQEHVATVLQGLGWSRNDVNPCVYYNPELDFEVEIHGDDFLGGGLRESAYAVKKQLEENFLVKVTTIISPHEDDAKEGWFLKRLISVDEGGYHMQLDNRYSSDLVSRLGLTEAKSVTTPGGKDCGKGVQEKALNAQAHREYRGGAGVGQHMADHRVDSTVATKECARAWVAPPRKRLSLRSLSTLIGQTTSTTGSQHPVE